MLTSKAFRTGRLVSDSVRGPMNFTYEGKTIPCVSFCLEGKYYIGFGQYTEETTDVMLIGNACVDFFKELSPQPGDEIRLSYACLYCPPNHGPVCRVFDPSQIEVIPRTVAEAAKNSAADFSSDDVSAEDFFAQFIASKNKQN